MDERSQYINDALIRIYSDILWIEEKELRKSRFNDLTIKEMHAIETPFRCIITKRRQRLQMSCT